MLREEVWKQQPFIEDVRFKKKNEFQKKELS